MLKKRILVLDDEWYRHKEFDKNFADAFDLTHVYSVDDAIGFVEREPAYDVMMLDHDLGDYKTGADFAKYLATLTEKRPRLIVIHSWNPSGARYMMAILTEGGYDKVRLVPFGGTVQIS